MEQLVIIGYMRKSLVGVSVLLVVVVSLLISLRRPYLVSFPLIEGEWNIFRFLAWLYPAVISSLLAIVVILKKEEERRDLLWKTILGLVIFSFVSTIYFATKLFYLWRSNEIGRYFLPPYSDFYSRILWRFFFPYLKAFIMAGGLVLLFRLLSKFGKSKKLFGQTELLTATFAGFALGLERSLLAILLGLLISVVISLFKLIRTSSQSVRLVVPLLVGIWIAIFWGREIGLFLLGVYI